MKKQKSKETVISVNTNDGNLNGVPRMQFFVAKQGLEALNRGMMLTRFATPKRCMEIISQVTGQIYKRTDRQKALRDAQVVMYMLEEERRQKAEDAILARSA